MPSPIALTDSELEAVMSAARVLSVADRDAFMRQVAAVLATQPVLGDGLVARVCREIQKRYFDAPDLSRAHGAANIPDSWPVTPSRYPKPFSQSKLLKSFSARRLLQ